MSAQLVRDALLMAIWRRGKPDALLHHSDQGSRRHPTIGCLSPVEFERKVGLA